LPTRANRGFLCGQPAVAVGVDEGLKHDSAIHCDELVSLLKTVLTDYIGALSRDKLAELNQALAAALDLT